MRFDRYTGAMEKSDPEWEKRVSLKKSSPERKKYIGERVHGSLGTTNGGTETLGMKERMYPRGGKFKVHGRKGKSSKEEL